MRKDSKFRALAGGFDYGKSITSLDYGKSITSFLGSEAQTAKATAVQLRRRTIDKH